MSVFLACLCGLRLVGGRACVVGCLTCVYVCVIGVRRVCWSSGVGCCVGLVCIVVLGWLLVRLGVWSIGVVRCVLLVGVCVWLVEVSWLVPLCVSWLVGWLECSRC